MNSNNKKLEILFKAAKTVSADEGSSDDRAPFGFSTRIVHQYFHKHHSTITTWGWESFVFKTAIGVIFLTGIAFWIMRADLEVYSDEYIEARMIESNIEQEIL